MKKTIEKHGILFIFCAVVVFLFALGLDSSIPSSDDTYAVKREEKTEEPMQSDHQNASLVMNSETDTETVKEELKPVTLSAGHYCVGRDIPEGRYRATHKGDSTNFQVWEKDSEDLKVNTIIGVGKIAEDSFTFWAIEGDIMDLGGKVTFTPVD